MHNSFNMISHRISNHSAHADDDILSDALYAIVRQLIFSENPKEARELLSSLLSITEEDNCFLVEYFLVDFAIGKGNTECSKVVCEETFGVCPTLEDMKKYSWFRHLMSHPIRTIPYTPKEMCIHNDEMYWRNFHTTLFFHLQNDSNLALDFLDYLAGQGDIMAMNHMAGYYFSNDRYTKALPLLGTLYKKWKETEWRCWIFTTNIHYLAHLYEYGIGTVQDFDKASQIYKELDDHWGFDSKAKFHLGQIAEQRHNYFEAFCYYRETIDCESYGKYSSYRDTYPNDLLPRRLEIAFRKLKKELYPAIDSIATTTCNYCRSIELRLKVLMNTMVTIDWGDGNTETIKWKIDDWSSANHSYSSEKSHRIVITTDEENTLIGFHAVTTKSICALDITKSKGLMYLLCSNQYLEHLELSKAEYLSILDIHGNKLQKLNMKKNKLLTIADCSNNPLKTIACIKYPPICFLSIRKTKLSAKLRKRLQYTVSSNAGKLLAGAFIHESTESITPTLLYYMKNSSWKEILPILQQMDEEDWIDINSKSLHRLFDLLKTFRHIIPCPYQRGFLWVSRSYVEIAHRFALRKTGRIIDAAGSEEEFYLYKRPWNMILGTSVKDKSNRLPFMGLPQRSNAYFAAMCLYNMAQNDEEMKRYKIPQYL